MVQGRFVMASWARRLFQISDRNNNGKEWVILQITQLEYLQTNVLMFRWRTKGVDRGGGLVGAEAPPPPETMCVGARAPVGGPVIMEVGPFTVYW
jgi:hypothetical protein